MRRHDKTVLTIWTWLFWLYSKPRVLVEKDPRWEMFDKVKLASGWEAWKRAVCINKTFWSFLEDVQVGPCQPGCLWFCFWVICVCSFSHSEPFLGIPSDTVYTFFPPQPCVLYSECLLTPFFLSRPGWKLGNEPLFDRVPPLRPNDSTLAARMGML